MRGNLRDDLFDLGLANGLLRLLGTRMRCVASLIDVNGLVGQVAVVDVLGTQFGCSLQSTPLRISRCGALQTATWSLEKIHGFCHRGFDDIHLLEAARQRSVFSKMPRYSVNVVAPMR